MSMCIELQLQIMGDDDSVIRADEVLHLDKGDDRLEAIGLSFSGAGRSPGARGHGPGGERPGPTSVL
jgi:hypothetical protein